MIMKPDELFSKSVEKGEIAPLYYFHGDEPYLIERAVKLPARSDGLCRFERLST
jgi:DNA polymerase III delta subunit